MGRTYPLGFGTYCSLGEPLHLTFRLQQQQNHTQKMDHFYFV